MTSQCCEGGPKSYGKCHGCQMTDKDFIDFINKSQVPVEKITKELGVSKTTVQRWKEGRSMPHPAVRSWVIKAFNIPL